MSIQDGSPNSRPELRLQNYVEPRSLKFVGVKSLDESRQSEEDFDSFVNLIRILCKTTLLVSCLLFVAVAVSAACLCRPILILGSLLVSLLFLSQGIYGHKLLKQTTRSVLVGYSCLSGFLSVISLASALYLFSGQFVVACISPLHTNNKTSMTQLYVIEVTTLITTVPLLVGSVASLISAVISSTETKRSSMKRHEPQLFLYLQDSYNENSVSSKGFDISTKNRNTHPSAPAQLEVPDSTRSNTPPPPYKQGNESFA